MQNETEPNVVVIMGVSGSGKTTIGRLLAAELGWSFRDADDFHSAENIARMSAGIPLTDADRRPWLKAIHDELARVVVGGQSVILACSALKQSYRAQLSDGLSKMTFILLDADRKLLAERMATRDAHFMPPGLLDSQLDTLERPEDAVIVDAGRPPFEIVSDLLARFNTANAQVETIGQFDTSSAQP